MTLQVNQVGLQATIANQAASGQVALPSGVIDEYRILVFNQTTASIAMTLPTPSDTVARFSVEIANLGTAAISVEGISLGNQARTKLTWGGATPGWFGGGSSAQGFQSSTLVDIRNAASAINTGRTTFGPEAEVWLTDEGAWAQPIDDGGSHHWNIAGIRSAL